MINDFRAWSYSSYHEIISNENTMLKREEVIAWFGNLDRFKHFHLLQHEGNRDLIIEVDE